MWNVVKYKSDRMAGSTIYVLYCHVFCEQSFLHRPLLKTNQFKWTIKTCSSGRQHAAAYPL